jgi:hypothetical protein
LAAAAAIDSNCVAYSVRYSGFFEIGLDCLGG